MPGTLFRNLVPALCLWLAGAGSALAQGDCSLPDRPAIPDGATAPEAEMVKAQKAVRGFVAKSETFLACIELRQAKAQVAALHSNLPFTPDEQAAWNGRFNDGVTLQTEMAEKYNVQVRIFKARGAKGG